MSSEGVLVLDNVSKSFSRLDVLRAVSLNVGSGELHVIGGGNGAGKSTLLGLGAGILRPSRGSLRLSCSVAYAPAAAELPGAMTTRALVRGLVAVSGQSSDPRSWLDRLGYSAGPATRVGDLSKGNAQKVLLAATLASAAPLLVLDEPWSGLDTPSALELTRSLDDVRRAGRAVLLVDHQGHAAALDDAVCHVLERGRLISARRPQDRQGARVDITLTSATLRQPPGFSVPVVVDGTWLTELRILAAAADTNVCLSEAIGAGWSVRSVRPAGDDGSTEL